MFMLFLYILVPKNILKKIFILENHVVCLHIQYIQYTMVNSFNTEKQLLFGGLRFHENKINNLQWFKNKHF